MEARSLEGTLEVREPSRGAWIPLVSALTWMRYAHALDMNELISTSLTHLDAADDEELRIKIQETWRELADHASIGRLTVRGRRLGQHKEQELVADDLRNCQFLAWSAIPQKAPPTQVESEVGSGSREYVVQVRRYEHTFSGEWRGMADQSGFDFDQVIVSSHQLLALYPPPKASVRKLRSRGESANRALRWLEAELDSLPVRSRPRPDFLQVMRTEFNLPLARARDVWRRATATRKEWSVPGPRGKFGPRKIDPKKI